MMNRNAITLSLFTIGVFSCIDMVVLFDTSQWKVYVSLVIIGLLVDLFPLRLPNGVVYSSGTVVFIYALARYGYVACEVAFIAGATASLLKLSKGRLTKLRCYRFFGTIGMYALSAGGAWLVLHVLGAWPVVVQLFVTITVFEAINMVLFACVQRSIGGHLPYTLREFVQAVAVPVVIFTIILTRFLSITGARLLFTEVVFTLFFLVLLYVFSVQYRKMADKYKESEQNYRLIAENTLDMIVVLDADGRVTYVSPSHHALLGWGGNEYVGKYFADAIHSEDRHSVEACLNTMRAQMKPFQIQFQYRHWARGWVTVEGTGSPVTKGDGTLDRMVLVIRDVTDRAETEELLRKSDKLAVVGQLAAGVAHELRNPLTALKGFLQLLEKKVESGSEYIQIMMNEMNRIELIIGEFLILAKPHVVQFQRRNPQALLQSVIALLDTQAIMNNVQIVTDVDPDIPDILCEENQLKQVFINILKNAIEAMPSGGQISIEVARDDEHRVVLRFSDQGVGIPQENLARLGEPFYTTKESGTGLGLMISYKIVQAHKGQMSIRSNVNQGTTVEICLPEVS